MTIKNLKIVSIPVRDQEAAKRFYAGAGDLRHRAGALGAICHVQRPGWERMGLATVDCAVRWLEATEVVITNRE
jgi:hypothetical protein